MDAELATRIEAMFAELQADRYDGKHDEVLSIIRDARDALAAALGELGPWEAQELADAEAAVHMNLLLLALHATEKAIAVSRLPRDEYEYGFNRRSRSEMNAPPRPQSIGDFVPRAPEGSRNRDVVSACDRKSVRFHVERVTAMGRGYVRTR
jgi:hypothetical protein